MVQTCIHPNIDIEFLESQIGQLIEFLEPQNKTKKTVLKCGKYLDGHGAHEGGTWFEVHEKITLVYRTQIRVPVRDYKTLYLVK